MLFKTTPIIVALITAATKAAKVEISNTEVRHDVLGNIMDTHDGNIVQYEPNGLYWYYSMGYQDCVIEHGVIPPRECPGIYDAFGQCGFRTDHALRVYSSPDLASWTLESENALPDESRPYGIYFRPKVVYNKATDKYVLWINHLPDAATPLAAYHDTRYVVGMSDSKAGPFTVVREKAALSQSAPGDADILVTEDGKKAYIAYNGWYNDHTILVEELTDTFMDSRGAELASMPISPAKNEAPQMFYRNGWYYIMYGHTCCFCKEGAGAHVKVARNPLGPWIDTGVELNPEIDRHGYRLAPG